MHWGLPYSLLLLFGAIPLIFILHSLRPRGVQVRTAALFLLERVLKERPVGRRLGWLLRKNLLIVLQILIALALIGALADPSLLGYGEPAGDVVVVVDLSASMKAVGRAGSRFEEARRAFSSLVDAMPSGQRVMVIGAGPWPKVLSPFTSDRQRLADLARRLRPTDAPAQVREAILFAHSFLRQGSDDRVVVLSDGSFEGAGELPWHLPHLRLVRAEGGGRNVGIMGFEVRRVPADPAEVEIMVSVKNFTDRPVRVPLILTVAERTLVREIVEIPAQERGVMIYSYRGPLAGRATAVLEIDDDFPTDNRAFLVLSRTPTIRLLYSGKENLFLDQLFRSFPQTQVTRADGLSPETLARQGKQYDLVILNGTPSPPVTEGNFIFINTTAEGIPLKLEGKVPGPRPLPWLERHPLTQGLRLDDLYIKEALRLIPLGGGTVLSRSEETPLIYAVERDGLRALVIGFDLLDSDLPFRVSFPLLFGNALAWFRPGEAEFPGAHVPAGAIHTLHLKEAVGRIEVRTPSGVSREIEPISRAVRFPDTTEVGFYTFKTGESAGEFAVNLFDEGESRIERPLLSPPQAEGEGERGSEKSMRKGLSLWSLLLSLALLLLVAEGLLIYRRDESFYPMLYRLPALLAVAVALVNPKFFKAVEALDVVLGVDFSRSVGQEGKDRALQVLEEARRLKDPKTRIGLLSFGKRPAWEFFPRDDFLPSDFSPSVERGETDIAAALQSALAQIGEGHEGRVLLVSDGNENRGEASQVVPLLRSHDVRVWTLPVSFSRGRNEIYLRDLVVPHQVDSAETFEVRGAIESLHDAAARIKLLRDGVIRAEIEMELKPGTNWVSLKQALVERGSHTFELLVESPHDTLAENNLLRGVVEVKGPPRVLYLHAREESQRFLSRVLATQGYEVAELAANQARLTLPELSAYDLLVLDNLPAYALSQAGMEALERYVRDLGGGLIVVGGPQSYGAGGYYRTPLERVLPVEMRPPARLQLPHVALLFVLDKSGSMGTGPQGVTKLDLAKAAAIASAELLNPSDEVGILAFDAGWDWVVPFSPAGSGEWIFERISSLESDGGTDLYKTMIEAHRAFSEKEAAVKHILVLSDGLTEKQDFGSLVGQMTSEGITVSTVSVGRDADFSLMAGIARGGKGRGYVTVDPRTIPQIFTTETLLISRDLLVEKVVHPEVVRREGPMRDLGQKGIPPVRGYVLTHPKPLAEVLVTVGEDPLLTSWRYGLGRVAAFTSDLSGRWGREWVQWEDFPQWAGQLARSVVRRVSQSRVRTRFRQDGEEVRALVDFYSSKGRHLNQLSLGGILAGPGQIALKKDFHQVAPGRYEARFPVPKRGIYLMTLYDKRGEPNESPVGVTVPFVSPYPPEYRELKPNAALLSRLAEETGGEMLRPEGMEVGLKRLLTPDPNRETAAKESWWAFSISALLLFLADLAARRFLGGLQAQSFYL